MDCHSQWKTDYKFHSKYMKIVQIQLGPKGQSITKVNLNFSKAANICCEARLSRKMWAESRNLFRIGGVIKRLQLFSIFSKSIYLFSP